MVARTAESGVGSRKGVGRVAAEEAFVEYVEARQAGLLRFTYLLTGDHHTSEDLVQSALAKTYLSWGKLRDPGALDAYVRRVIVNEHASIWRRAWRRREHSTDNLPETHAAPEGLDVETQDALWRLVRELPTRQRATLVLRYFEDMTEAEAARVLGCSVGTVKSQTSRALERLRTRVAENPGLLGGEGVG